MIAAVMAHARVGLMTAVLTVTVSCGAPGDSTVTTEGPVVLETAHVNVVGTSPSIAVVRDLDVGADGSIWLLNSVDPLFIGFRPDG
ncbi:MAG: hypothetical protein HKN73_02695, partial [Gemmatimonadetes bacterium]|nr:hypothetical protein [Gemmatimonadota bacterium]